MNTHPNDHIVRSYDEEQHRLVAEIVRMGEMSVAQLEAALDVIERRDESAARRIIANDEAIDALEQQISHDVMRLALRGPMARDLREILAGLRIPADIERIGDYAANVAKRSIALAAVPPLPQVQGLRALGRLAAQQVRRALDAYRGNDAEAAQALREDDARLDAQYTALFRELLTYMMEDPRNITPCTHLLFMAKNLERIGDHATNIAENVWFLVHGDVPLPPREKRDETSSVDHT
ncbi:MAG: phosphate transport system regulatory protein PhoU [Lysobacteraceae bacterium SCN 69-123]|jgi:phosphate transport system protein|uniref:phosphate signaling complex protein PhoU n=1 Tax=Stenotrophomonas acidaminiphila TaxID=128780 RepID=UPI00086C516C|nr:phosphate signaling complex protein PhoU [Stenotrophomonas acidaminiphila]MBN8801763.1 phosphate signaling complex protein PhoU [Stenotrophomonas acidaminiphila]MDF9441094.1 phosphate signaling complex protein PhoU [Stenotrophomonas acidaminiphila]ODU45666.1 MAG: phosphate transport system regulatory protein PhoU [Xanthomonadaceae bacterium SCN 69-123]OJY76456.1 MAG: phosphate transport system regulatory protein PhoU [Stenotrophomonas sp. 69-14]